MQFEINRVIYIYKQSRSRYFTPAPRGPRVACRIKGKVEGTEEGTTFYTHQYLWRSQSLLLDSL